MSNDIKIIKTVSTIGDFTNAEWEKIIQQPSTNKVVIPDANNWFPLPQTPSDPWMNYDFSSPVRARCYNRRCENETTFMTELMVGSLHFKTYMCKSCLEDIADKVRDELGISNPEQK